MINKYKHIKVKIYSFNQSRYPRVDRETLLPVARSAALNSNLEAWYPPGHGDLYESFYNSGLLKMFLNEGKEYVFVSNSDNLGATVDMNILNFLLNPPNNHISPEFLMEVTDKTRADVKVSFLEISPFFKFGFQNIQNLVSIQFYSSLFILKRYINNQFYAGTTTSFLLFSVPFFLMK